MPLTPSQTANSATNDGASNMPINPLPAADNGDQDVRTFPSNGAIPDEVRNLIPDDGYHVP